MMQYKDLATIEVAKSAKNGQTFDRRLFWRYCINTAGRTRGRAKKLGLPHNLTARDLDALLVDSGWRCAVSGIPLDPTAAPNALQNAFGPSLDRIVPKLGYVPGNVRIVCNIVNYAINEWGIGALDKLIEAMRAKG